MLEDDTTQLIVGQILGALFEAFQFWPQSAGNYTTQLIPGKKIQNP